ncbi:MAG TPA: hypothetical protein VEU96_22605 [Bryobacteraceae bacterium]|nr:hypothetical protein [Bryobacteraceae bacterium]
MIKLALAVFAGSVLACAQTVQLHTASAVLKRYQQALGGADAIKNVKSETRHGEATGGAGTATFVFYAMPFKWVHRVSLPNGREVTSGFDGRVSWSIASQGAVVDKDTPVEAARRDADLQYALHQPDYFQKLDFAGITDFEGHTCYWLHGTTHWGKDNNQFYDVQTGLLAGYRFQSDNASSPERTTVLFENYKSFGGPLVATKLVSRTGDRVQTITYTSVTYQPLEDSLFELPQAVRSLLGPPR